MQRRLISALFRPLNLVILVLSVGAGLMVALWLLPTGLVTYGALVVLTALDPQTAQPTPPVRAVRPPHGTAFQAELDAIARTQTRIEQSVAAADDVLRPALGRVTAQVNSIVEEAYTLATKGDTIVAYLQHVDVRDLNTQLVRLDSQIKMATDTMLRQQYQETRDAVAEQVTNAQALAAYRERIVAQLDNIRANLDNVLAETVRLRAAPAADARISTDNVSARLADVRADMDALGSILDTALTGVS